MVFHIAECYDKTILSLLKPSILTFCSSHYTTETKCSWKIVVRYSKCLNMADDVNWNICFLCQDSVSLFTLVHQQFLLLFLVCIRTEKYFDTSPTVLTNKYYFT